MPLNYENRLTLNPALIVGLGGTGKKVLMNFKETFLSYPQIKAIFKDSPDGVTPSLPDFIDLFCIDTDVFAANEEEKVEGARLREEEYYRINIQNANQITTNLDTETYNYLFEWFPQKLQNHIGNISQGAHQFRFTGRFGLFVEINKIYQQLKAKIAKIMARKNVNQDDLIVPLTNKQGQIVTPEFYIVSSICGGSGAGMLLDVAYLLRMAYYQLSGGKSKPTVVGITLTPEAFTQIAIDPNVNATGRLEGNGYSSLVEMFYFMAKENFPPSKSAKDILKQDRRNKFMVNFGPLGKSHDPNGFGAVSLDAPFDQAYLVGTSNLDDSATYYSIGAEFIFTKLATPLRAAQNSMLDNASQVLGQLSSDLEGKQLKCFSSLGYKSFYYPLDILMDLYTYKLSMDVTRWLKLATDKIVLEQIVQEFVEGNPDKLNLTAEGLFQTAKTIVDRKKYWDNPMYHTMRTDPNQREGESASAYILRKIQEMDTNKVRKDEIKKRTQVDFEKAAMDAAKLVREWAIEIINNPDLGAHVCLDVLTAFEKYLVRFPKDVLVRKDEEIKTAWAKEQREYTQARERLQGRLEGGFGLMGKLLELGTALSLANIREDYEKLEKEASEAVQMEYERFCLACAGEYLRYLSQHTTNLKKQVEEFARKLDMVQKNGFIERLYEQCLDKIKPYSRTQAFVRTYIFEDRDIEPFYKYLLGDLSNNDIEKDFLLNIDLKKNWDGYTNPTSNSLEEDIVKYCRYVIGKRMIGGIEDFIHWKDSVKKGFKKSLIQSFMNQSTPLITLNDRGNNQPQRMNIATLGIHDENSKLATEIKEQLQKSELGISIAPTRNHFEISFVQTLHGICPWNLASLTQWHDLYRKNHVKINCHSVLTNDGYPVLWASYGLIPAKTLEQLYLVYLLLRYEVHADEAKTKHGIEWNDELVQFELLYQQEKPQPMGRTVPELFKYLQNNTMGVYLINTLYKEGWNSMALPQQNAIVKKYLPLFTEKVKTIEDSIEVEIRTHHEVSAANDELLAIKKGILRIITDLSNHYDSILSQKPAAAVKLGS